ncbi:MAG: hypothetical protein ABIY70_16690 [Capsulimonas sp.]|uniref:hypothetical protein n=1 Tax=Capsulimonas sp. TaxID=2494211 RepID=UPI003263D2DA
MTYSKQRKIRCVYLACCCLLGLVAVTAGCSHQSPAANPAKPSDMSPAARDAMHRDMLGPSAAPASSATR